MSTIIRNSIIKNFANPSARDDKGVLAESHVFFYLRRQLLPNMDLRFWRTRQQDEIDFVLIKDPVPLPIEVKYQLKTPAVPPALLKFLKQYPNSPGGVVFSNDFHNEIEVNGKPIYFLPWENPAAFESVFGFFNP